MILIVLEALHVETTTVEEITLHRVVIGRVVPIVVKVYIISKLLVLYTSTKLTIIDCK